jgi:hypothetical protein
MVFLFCFDAAGGIVGGQFCCLIYYFIFLCMDENKQGERGVRYVKKGQGTKANDSTNTIRQFCCLFL